MSKKHKEAMVTNLADLAQVMDLPTLTTDKLVVLPPETPAGETGETMVEIQDVPLAEEVPVQAEVAVAIAAADSVTEVSAAMATNQSAALAMVDDLRAQIIALQAARAARRVNSGSKPRPNVTYTLLAKPPKWSSTPQVAQLQQILFQDSFIERHRQADGTIKVAEPELFAHIAAEAAAGNLRTTQPPVRIFQYYRSNLLRADCLTWA